MAITPTMIDQGGTVVRRLAFFGVYTGRLFGIGPDFLLEKRFMITFVQSELAYLLEKIVVIPGKERYLISYVREDISKARAKP